MAIDPATGTIAIWLLFRLYSADGDTRTLTDTVMQTNKTKVTLTVTLTLTDTVTVIFFMRISLTPIKR